MVTSRKERITAIKELLLSPIESKITTTKEKREKTNLALDNLKLWDKIKERGGTVDDLERLVNHQEIPNLENNDDTSAITIADEKPKLQSYGITITNKPKQIKQKDGSLRCMRCNKKIEIRVYDFEQLDDYKKHVENIHGDLYESERKELMGIYQK